ncbi:Bacteriophage protein gp37 [Burkholderia pseudomallei]|uniref:phage Gp37/Gp68 family protein n=1 Tax=Burkholderia pseudomallei TaxID=28450 RepID=UPI000977D0BD|nr:phage Gp37/Gp68 family protein [Burkholderia pseudomallei]MBF3398832.1 phage Gp37/Gp68 family protein [Burkholderia pseudomallei]MBF3792598.1 phage Gp37/Gp68 family protein [Burkholderia pseudomallei]MBF3817281.1 phage Gp37/Gp68 family protein [Burkholderia pseudomallei]MBF3946359.1 phage Gp37/Gp68 family protein [Burkholderia pseudomallei]MBF4000852.1 phage Gp37/Gp68 family protein [Burkholderia pseudomallei]
MSKNSKIEWCDHTWSPWEGCQKVGPGCDHCYAEARNIRFGGGKTINWGPGAPRRRTASASWKLPLRWDRKARELGTRLRIFPSLCDPFDNAVDPAWRRDFFELIADTPNLDWLLLTKRIANAGDMIVDALLQQPGLTAAPKWPWPNVWLGATIVNQAEADRDIPKLLATPARVRFLSMEPLLGPVDLRFHIYSEPTGNFRTHGGKRQLELRRPADGGLHWVIAGGESGPGARPMHPDWARSLRDQCAAADVPFLFKQWGEWAPRTTDEQKLLPVPCSRTTSWPDGTVGCGDYQSNGDYGKCLFRVGKKATGRMLDGRRHDEFPEVTR